MLKPFFSDCTGLGVRVAVVDSGVHAAHPHVGGVAGGVAVGVAGAPDDFIDRLGHGTAVTAAIREKAPAAELWAVKVFDSELATDVQSLVDAIRWAADHGARLINLSLGTSNEHHAQLLSDAVAAAARRAAFIVAAYEDAGVRWLPGSLDGVLAVRLEWTCPRDRYRPAEENGRVVFHASGYPRSIPGVSPERNLQGLSFAVANMTGFAARALEHTRATSVTELISALRDAAIDRAEPDVRHVQL